MKTIPVLEIEKPGSLLLDNLYNFVSKITPDSYDVKKSLNYNSRIATRVEVTVSLNNTRLLVFRVPRNGKKRVEVILISDFVSRTVNKKQVLLTNDDVLKFTFKYKTILNNAISRFKTGDQARASIKKRLKDVYGNDIDISYFNRNMYISYTGTKENILDDTKPPIILDIEICINFRYRKQGYVYEVTGDIIKGGHEQPDNMYFSLLRHNISNHPKALITSENALFKYIDKHLKLKCTDFLD